MSLEEDLSDHFCMARLWRGCLSEVRRWWARLRDGRVGLLLKSLDFDQAKFHEQGCSRLHEKVQIPGVDLQGNKCCCLRVEQRSVKNHGL